MQQQGCIRSKDIRRRSAIEEAIGHMKNYGGYAGTVGIPVHRDRPFRSIVTGHSGASCPPIPVYRDRLPALAGIAGHDAGISGHDTGTVSYGTEMMLRI